MHRRAMLREFPSPTRPRAGRAPLNPGENSNGTFEEYVSGADTLEAARHQELADGKQPLVAQLTQLRAIGPKGAWVLVKELFGWRRFANRRELAGCLGLVPTPYASGDSQIDQGISKAGNRRARTLLVELAWSWL